MRSDYERHHDREMARFDANARRVTRRGLVGLLLTIGAIYLVIVIVALVLAHRDGLI